MGEKDRNTTTPDIITQLENLSNLANRGTREIPDSNTFTFKEGAQQSGYKISEQLRRHDLDKSTLASREVTLSSHEPREIEANLKKGIQVNNDTSADLLITYNNSEPAQFIFEYKTKLTKHTITRILAKYDDQGELITYELEIPDNIKNINEKNQYPYDTTQHRLAIITDLFENDPELLIAANNSNPDNIDYQIDPKYITLAKLATRYAEKVLQQHKEFNTLPIDQQAVLSHLIIGSYHKRLQNPQIRTYITSAPKAELEYLARLDLVLKGSLDKMIQEYKNLPFKMIFTPNEKGNYTFFRLNIEDSRDPSTKFLKNKLLRVEDTAIIHNVAYALKQRGDELLIEVILPSPHKERKTISLKSHIRTDTIKSTILTSDKDAWQEVFKYSPIRYSEELIE